MTRRIFRIIFRWMGWQIVGTIPEHPKFIIIGAPHTSNWDFIVAILAKYILKLDSKFLGKAELFRFPFGYFFRMLGGYPVQRDQQTNLVDSIVKIFDSKTHFSIGLAPEGTRKYVGKFKTGFYYIAAKAKIPIIMIGFDYVNKSLVIAPDAYWPTGDINKDMPEIMAFFQQFSGKRQEMGV